MDDRDIRATFCCDAHKKQWHNRALARGAPLMVLAQAWRQGRHRRSDPVAKAALTELCILLDKANAEDKAAGRQPAIETLRARYRQQGINLVT